MAERRKEELLKKRQKLEELRRAREERKKEKPDEPAEKPEEKPTSINKKEELDRLLAELKLPSNKPEKTEPVEPLAEEPPAKIDTTLPTLDGSQSVNTTTSTPIAPSSPSIPGKFIPNFITFEAVILDIPPKEIVYYNKEVQTKDTSFEPPPPSEDEIRAKIVKEFEEAEKQRKAYEEEEKIKAEIEKKREAKLWELSEEEKKIIFNLPEFRDFVDLSTKYVERAINENYDVLRDYKLGEDIDDEVVEGPRVKYVCSYFDDRWNKNRSVTDVNWSKKNPELFLASYNKNPYAVNDPDGIVCVWSLRLLDRPEFIFHSQSDVLTTMFSDFHPSYIIGGTYSGQILVWDMRSKSLPVFKTPLGAAGHTHPVYAMQMVGTQNAHNLITASTDGLVCSWQLDMMTQPQESLELIYTDHPKTEEVSVTTFGFQKNESSAFWVGTEEGNIYQANRYAHAGGKAGINHYDIYKGHWGPITGLHFHPIDGQVDFSDIFLTSSVDWTVKMWRAKSVAKPSAVPQNIAPLYSFEGADDYIYDVKWSPTNPALFGCVDGKGNFALWNLNDDTEVPIASKKVGDRALNKLQWDKEGRRAAIGSSDGRVHIYDIGELCNPRDEEWNIMQSKISEMMDSNDVSAGRYALAK
ncbi:WD40-repeat-containing domain protein [Glomus cerebriforme]|uniref:WD40-repeat-containing domain protein n=1 Tax=Glomus cerebriforme TaxID=658196 RepID=A0A397S5A2_9GLOM|nr:WD40-repeat-containing domain protein [Glomus cerebriforme]